jgi:hypothetical protein
MVKAIRELSLCDKFRSQISTLQTKSNQMLAESGLCEGGRKQNWIKLRYQCELQTKLHGGGIEAGKVDLLMPIHVTGIRGKMRKVWRLQKFEKIAPDESNTQKKWVAVFREERAMWGGLGELPEESQIRIKVHSIEKPSNISQAEPDVGYKWEVEISTPGFLAEEANWTFLEWARNSGVGAKNKKGYGKVYATKLQEPIHSVDLDKKRYCWPRASVKYEIRDGGLTAEYNDKQARATGKSPTKLLNREVLQALHLRQPDSMIFNVTVSGEKIIALEGPLP